MLLLFWNICTGSAAASVCETESVWERSQGVGRFLWGSIILAAPSVRWSPQRTSTPVASYLMYKQSAERRSRLLSVTRWMKNFSPIPDMFLGFINESYDQNQVEKWWSKLHQNYGQSKNHSTVFVYWSAHEQTNPLPVTWTHNKMTKNKQQ